MMAAFLALLAGSAAASAQAPCGTTIVDEYQLAYLFNGNLGGGKLNFQGNPYDFKVRRVGIGGIGAMPLSRSGAQCTTSPT
jgi:hypothetical protein